VRLTYTLEELQAEYDAGSDASGSATTGGHRLSVVELTEERLVAEQTVRGDAVRVGGVVSGVTLFRVFDGTAYLVTLAQTPKGQAAAFTVDASIQFLRTAPVGPLLATGIPLRFGRRLSVVDVTIRSASVPDGPVAHGVVTYAPHFV
jgi:uncharacterized protein (TIGR00369 family)